MQSLIETVTADIQSSENLRLLAVMPLVPTSPEYHSSARDDHGVTEVTYAYAYEPTHGAPRYFRGRATVQATAGWPRAEFKTARQAVEACLYSNGFGGRTPKPISED